MTESIDSGMDLRALAPFVAVIAGAFTTRGSQLDRAAVEDHGRGFGSSAISEPKNGAMVVDRRLESARGGFGGRRSPRREVLGHVTPWPARTDEPAESVDDLAEVMDTLTDVPRKRAKLGENALPFEIGDVAGIGLVGSHILNHVDYCTKVHNTL